MKTSLPKLTKEEIFCNLSEVSDVEVTANTHFPSDLCPENQHQRPTIVFGSSDAMRTCIESAIKKFETEEQQPVKFVAVSADSLLSGSKVIPVVDMCKTNVFLSDIETKSVLEKEIEAGIGVLLVENLERTKMNAVTLNQIVYELAKSRCICGEYLPTRWIVYLTVSDSPNEMVQKALCDSTLGSLYYYAELS